MIRLDLLLNSTRPLECENFGEATSRRAAALFSAWALDMARRGVVPSDERIGQQWDRSIRDAWEERCA